MDKSREKTVQHLRIRRYIAKYDQLPYESYTAYLVLPWLDGIDDTESRVRICKCGADNKIK